MDWVRSGLSALGSAAGSALVNQAVRTSGTTGKVQRTLESQEWTQFTSDVAQKLFSLKEKRVDHWIVKENEDKLIEAVQELVHNVLISIATADDTDADKDALTADEVARKLIDSLIRIVQEDLGELDGVALSGKEAKQRIRSLVSNILERAFPNKAKDGNLPKALQILLQGKEGLLRFVPTSFTGGNDLTEFNWETLVELCVDYAHDVYGTLTQLKDLEESTDPESCALADFLVDRALQGIRGEDGQGWTIRVEDFSPITNSFLTRTLNSCLSEGNATTQPVFQWVRAKLRSAILIALQAVEGQGGVNKFLGTLINEAYQLNQSSLKGAWQDFERTQSSILPSLVENKQGKPGPYQDAFNKLYEGADESSDVWCSEVRELLMKELCYNHATKLTQSYFSKELLSDKLPRWVPLDDLLWYVRDTLASDLMFSLAKVSHEADVAKDKLDRAPEMDDLIQNKFAQAIVDALEDPDLLRDPELDLPESLTNFLNQILGSEDENLHNARKGSIVGLLRILIAELVMDADGQVSHKKAYDVITGALQELDPIFKAYPAGRIATVLAQPAEVADLVSNLEREISEFALPASTALLQQEVEAAVQGMDSLEDLCVDLELVFGFPQDEELSRVSIGTALTPLEGIPKEQLGTIVLGLMESRIKEAGMQRLRKRVQAAIEAAGDDVDAREAAVRKCLLTTRAEHALDSQLETLLPSDLLNRLLSKRLAENLPLRRLLGQLLVAYAIDFEPALRAIREDAARGKDKIAEMPGLDKVLDDMLGSLEEVFQEYAKRPEDEKVVDGLPPLVNELLKDCFGSDEENIKALRVDGLRTLVYAILHHTIQGENQQERLNSMLKLFAQLSNERDPVQWFKLVVKDDVWKRFIPAKLHKVFTPENLLKWGLQDYVTEAQELDTELQGQVTVEGQAIAAFLIEVMQGLQKRPDGLTNYGGFVKELEGALLQSSGDDNTQIVQGQLKVLRERALSGIWQNQMESQSVYAQKGFLIRALRQAFTTQRPAGFPENDFSAEAAKEIIKILKGGDGGTLPVPKLFRSPVNGLLERQLGAQIDELTTPEPRARLVLGHLLNQVYGNKAPAAHEVADFDIRTVQRKFKKAMTKLLVDQAKASIEEKFGKGLLSFILKLLIVPIVWISALVMRQRLWSFLISPDTDEKVRIMIWNVLKANNGAINAEEEGKELRKEMDHFFQETGLLWWPTRKIVSKAASKGVVSSQSDKNFVDLISPAKPTRET